MIPLSHGLILAIILFILGLSIIIIRRNLLFMVLGLEVMINSAALSFIVVGTYLNQVDGQIIYILIITLAASESAIALALLLKFYRFYRTLNIDCINEIHK